MLYSDDQRERAQVESVTGVGTVMIGVSAARSSTCHVFVCMSVEAESSLFCG